MAKTARKIRTNKLNINNQHITADTAPRATINKSQTAFQAYDPIKYIKSDLKWSAISASVVVVLLIIAYFLFR